MNNLFIFNYNLKYELIKTVNKIKKKVFKKFSRYDRAYDTKSSAYWLESPVPWYSRIAITVFPVCRRTCLGCKTRIECSVAAPPCNTRRLSLPDISAVVAVALLSSFFAALPNSFSTFSTNGPRLNLVLIVVWSLIMFTDTSPVLCKDANPYRVALAFGLLLDLV